MRENKLLASSRGKTNSKSKSLISPLIHGVPGQVAETASGGCYPVTPYAKWGKSGCWLLAGTKINSNPNSKDNYHSYR